MALPIALQLYTVRDPMKADFEGTLAQVAKIGFKDVELAGLYNRPAKDVRAILDRLGLRAVSAHVGYDALRSGLDAAVADAKALGYSYIVMPYLDGSFRTAEGYAQVAHKLSDIGRVLRGHGITLCYHNHSFEFEKLPSNIRGIDILYTESDPQALAAELDVYWVQHGHDDPIAWIKRLTGRVPLLHIKDMAKTADRGFAEVGTGSVDMKSVVHHAAPAGVKHLIVEQDSNWKGSPLESARISFENFRKIVGG